MLESEVLPFNTNEICARWNTIHTKAFERK